LTEVFNIAIFLAGRRLLWDFWNVEEKRKIAAKN
jgi:adenylate cyclase